MKFYEKRVSISDARYYILGLPIVRMKRNGRVTAYKLFGITFLRRGKRKIARRKVHGAYDMNKLIECYAGVGPKKDKVTIQHGWTPLDESLPSDLNNKTSLMLAWSKRFKNNWERQSIIPCEVMGTPFVIYRHLNNIQQIAEARGTIAYPAHSTAGLEAKYDIDAYCAELRALPEEFQPVTISLHPVDIEHFDLDVAYQERGFETVCAFSADRPFYEAFYEIMRRFKYATSNEPGSYTFYAVEMGIPFFILGPKSQIDNSAGLSPDCPAKVTSILEFRYGKIAYDLFSNSPREVITEQQKEFVQDELGMNDAIGKEQLRALIEKHNV